MKPKICPVVLLVALLGAGSAQAAEPTVETVAPGLQHLVLSRGEIATTTSYRILLGDFDNQAEAGAALADLRANGFAAALEATGSSYRLYSPASPTRGETLELRRRLSENGYSVPEQIEKVGQDLTNPEGPWKIHVLEADPKKIRVEVVHAYDAAIGLETTAELAERHDALAAINGGYFRMTGLLAGDSQGTLRIDGRLLSEPDRGRAAVGFYAADGATQAVFGRLSFRGEVRIGDATVLPIDGINRSRKLSEIILFTPEFHRTTLTSPGGAEIIVENGRIAEIREGVGSSMIPASGMVLSIGNDRLQQIRPHLQPGAPISVDTRVIPLLPDPEGEWDRAEDIVGAGPLLLWKGKRLEEPEAESISKVFFLARHPRTAAGVRADGTLLFVTVDGRRPEHSVGMSLPELTDLMIELGCVSAINLDGGGSTTMVIEGRLVNQPSGGDARRNADAILIYPKES
ncbi:MAG: phosphodiester glycosidase family protein [Thermoanaerobaculales bacterium]|nr:phosphodiester glycosidase family protein [Thermoanaerobaculales bacterium]